MRMAKLGERKHKKGKKLRNPMIMGLGLLWIIFLFSPKYPPGFPVDKVDKSVEKG